MVPNMVRDASLVEVPHEERELVSRLRERDEGAFETLVRDYARGLLATARRILGSEECARDVVQETLLAAFQSIASFRGEAQLSTWLRRIAINKCLMVLRSRRRRPEISIEQWLPAFREDGHLKTPCEKWSTTPDLLMRSETRELVRGSIGELPETYRTVLLLRDIEELTTSEVASLLGVSINTVKVRLHRARQALRARLDPYMRAGAL